MSKISVLVSARKNSKYLNKFLTGYSLRTSNGSDIECLVMLNDGDTWNNDLVEYYQTTMDRIGIPRDQQPLRFFRENMGLGRGGLHKYFNELLKHATGDWIIYFCEDHYIVMENWDEYIRSIVSGRYVMGDSQGKEFPLDPAEPWVIVPKFDNCGAMNHVLSRGFVSVMDNKLGRHGWIDSYINDLCAAAWGRYPKRVIRTDLEMFHDFTHDKPNPMDDSHLQSVISDAGRQLPKYDSEVVKHRIQVDAQKLKEVDI